MTKHSKYYYDVTRNLSYEEAMKVKQIKKINWINSWVKGNKKEKYEISIRLGKLSLLEIEYSFNKLRFIFLNFGFEI